MINFFIEFFQFLNSLAPLLFSVFAFALLAILLSKSIKKHANIYYIVSLIAALLIIVPFILGLFGVESFSFFAVPILGVFLRNFFHMGGYGFPLLVIIMYIGALDMKNPYAKKLMSIRKELSIMSGFPVISHALIRIFNNFPSGWKYFTDHDAFLESNTVVSDLGAGFTSFSYILGIIMISVFLPLWITSFTSIHKRMGGKSWKKLQKWSYVLYACLFIHAMGLQLGGLLNPRQRETPKPQVETTANADTRSRGENGRPQENSSRPNNSESRQPEQRGQRGQNAENRNTAQAGNRENKPAQGEAKAPARGGGRQQAKGFSDIEIGQNTKRYIHIASLLLIFGSYLILRIRKAGKRKLASK